MGDFNNESNSSGYADQESNEKSSDGFNKTWTIVLTVIFVIQFIIKFSQGTNVQAFIYLGLSIFFICYLLFKRE